MRILSFVCLISILVSCSVKEKNLTRSEMYQIVKDLDHKFSVGVQKHDSAYLTDIYSDSAQYVTPKRPIIKGKIAIGNDWAGFLRMKEHPIDLILNIKDVNGDNNIIYETGTGYTLLGDSTTKWEFNYVNVWRKQTDGSFKLEIDTYN